MSARWALTCRRRSGICKTISKEPNSNERERTMGAFSVRLPESLHSQVKKLAQAEGISMNQFVMLAVSEKVTRLDADAQFAHLEALRAVGEEMAEEEDVSLKDAALNILDRAGDEEPEKGDRIPAGVAPE